MDDLVKLALSLVGGGAIGVLAKAWQVRSKVSLMVTTVDFENPSSAPTDKTIPIPNELQEMSKKSKWLRDLPPQLTEKELVELIDSDHAETVEQLDKLSEFLPSVLEFIKTIEGHDAEAGRMAYMRFFASTVDAKTMSYYTISIGGALRRKELEFTDLDDWFPAKATNPLEESRLFQKGAEKLDEFLDMVKSAKSDAVEINALKLATQWHPTATKKTAETVLQQVSSQVPLNRTLLERLRQLLSSSLNEPAAGSTVIVKAILANHGEMAVSVDRFACLRLPAKLPVVMLTASDPVVSCIALPPGVSLEVTYRSREPLRSDLAGSIKSLSGTQALSCILLTRLLTRRAFQRQWIESDVVPVSDLTDEIVGQFTKRAATIRVG